MNLATKQMGEKNQRAFALGLVLQILILFLGALGYAAGNISPVLINVRAVIDIICIIFLIIFYKQLKSNPKFMYAAGFDVIIGYCLLVYISPSLYTYAVMYPVAMLIMIYMDKTFTRLAGIMCIICNIILAIKYYVTDPADASQIVMQLLLAIFTSVIAILVTDLQSNQREESLKTVTESAEKSTAVAEDIARLAVELSDKFEIAKESAAETVDTVDTSVKAVDEIASSVKLTAENIETQTMLTSDIQDNLQSTEEATADMKKASDEAHEAVAEGMNLMQKLSVQSELTADLNRESQTSTNELNIRIKDVGDIIGEIVDISSKTNLLALNASIEAARAGEAGRGFAVVADEIRQLSEQTKDSAGRITSIIAKLTDEAKLASTNMSKSIDASEKQNEMIDEARNQIGIIDEKNAIQMQLMDNISTQVGDILRANTEIMDSISNLSATSEEVAASSENCNTLMDNSLDSMNSLNSLLDEINKIAERLKAIAEQ